MITQLRIEAPVLPLEMETPEHMRLAALYAAALREPDDEESLHEQYDDLRETDQIRVARIGGSIVGMAAYDVNPKSIYLGALAVERGYRGQGFVGSAVLNHIIDESIALGAETVDLSCYERVIPFYQAHQFEVVGRDGLLYDMRRDI